MESTGDLGNRKVKFQLVINCSARDETERLGLQNMKDK